MIASSGSKSAASEESKSGERETSLIEEQLDRLQQGCVDLISRSEIANKIKMKKTLRVKFGADPTRADLHLGHTVVLNKLRQFQDLGHGVDFIIGDFTALIGDPTGRNETRPPLTPDEIMVNARTYQEQVFKVLDPEKTQVHYNNAWLGQMRAADFIRLTGQYTLARMLERDDFTKRFQAHVPISMHELVYPLCQGYDSVYLKSDLELGGTDQKFNLLVGRELQKSYGQSEQQCILTLPLLEGLDGVQKMSKSSENYISLVDSPKDMFGKTMRISDELMWRWYELLTDHTPQELQKFKSQVQHGSLHPRQAKVQLAQFLVRRFHSDTAAKDAAEEFDRVFSQKQMPDSMPEFSVPADQEMLLQIVLRESGLVASASEAKRLIQSRAVELDGQKILDEKHKISLTEGQIVTVKAGKTRFLKLLGRRPT